MFNIVLVEPEIPANTGNIARTCSVTGCRLHLVEPLGFSIDDKHLKRAGLDYWHLLDVHVYPGLDDFFSTNFPQGIDPGLFFLATTKGKLRHTETKYPAGAYLFFGKETKGLPAELLKSYPGRCIRVPMLGEVRSLNLSNSVAIVVYEALRQHDYPGMH